MPQSRFTIFRRILVGLVASLVISFTRVGAFFDLSSRSVMDGSFITLVPALAVFVCLLAISPTLETTFAHASPQTRWLIFLYPLFSTLFLIPATHYSFLPLLFILFILIVTPAAPFIQKCIEAGGILRAAGAWLFSFIFSAVLISFLDAFYSNPIEVILLTLFLQGTLSIGGYFLMGRIRRVTGKRFSDALVHASLFLLLTIFIAWLFHANRRVSLFPASYFLIEESTREIFLFTSLAALPWQIWLHLQLKFSGLYNRLKHTKTYAYISQNLAGLSLAFGFFVLYLLFASVLNDPRFDVDDIYFDADHFNYRVRLTTDTWQDYYWRSVHPFMILLFRPPVDLISVFLKGDKLWSAYVFAAVGGAACVYLAWMFIKHASGNSVYASLIAALLGCSASHLIFGSLLESYIFLAASLLLFYVLLIKDRPLPALMGASLATIGITYTNFAQNVIALFTVRPNIKQMFRFGVTVIVFLVLLTLLNNLLYPDAHPFFFVPSTLLAERQNLFPLNGLRIQALIRAFFFQNVIAPAPIFYDKDIPFIQFRFFKPEIDELSQYELPIQSFTAWVWLGFLLFAGALFVLNLKKNPHLRLSIALAGCLAFNTLLHLRYGKEFFLYSANWTYALVLFVGLAWQPLADRRWFQWLLVLLLLLVAWNNSILIKTILSVLRAQV
ncbi:MAG: hypothetical protein HXY38_07485 [Chloroflexi bacterium]|nr:hypothetical protein [Chloroflexota bacterium]